MPVSSPLVKTQHSFVYLKGGTYETKNNTTFNRIPPIPGTYYSIMKVGMNVAGASE